MPELTYITRDEYWDFFKKHFLYNGTQSSHHYCESCFKVYHFEECLFIKNLNPLILFERGSCLVLCNDCNKLMLANPKNIIVDSSVPTPTYIKNFVLDCDSCLVQFNM